MNDTFISLQTNNDRYLFIPTASVSITTDAQGNTFIQPNSNQDPNEQMATVSVNRTQLDFKSNNNNNYH